MNNIVDTLVRDQDWATTKMIGEQTGETLHLYGREDSRYLRGVAAKAKKLGIPVQWSFNPPPMLLNVPYVVDRESFPKEQYPVMPGARMYDLDCCDTPGMSCVAEAVSMIIDEVADENPHVCIIGRGHSVQGLAEELLLDDCTVTICHSKTKDLLACTHSAEVIVNAAPNTHPLTDVTKGRGNAVLDVSGSLRVWEDSNILTYIGSRDIGRLNTSILFNRFAVAFTR